MAKKKGKPQPRKSKKKRASSFMSSVKKMLLGVFAVVVCFIGVLFIYNWFYPVSKTRLVEKKLNDKDDYYWLECDTRYLCRGY